MRFPTSFFEILRMSPQKLAILFVCFLILSVAIVFGVSIHNPYYFDDFLVLRDNGWLHGLRPPLGWFRTIYVDSNQIFPGYRPTLMLSFWANIRLFGDQISVLRMGNIFLHTLNAFLLIQLLIFLRKKGFKDWIAWGAGFLFLFHPVQTLGINFLWKRSSLLEATFLLLSMNLHVKERNRANAYRVWVIVAQLFLCFLTVTTKESGIIFGGLLFLVDICFFFKRKKLLTLRNIILYGALGFLTLTFVWFRLEYINQAIASTATSFHHWRRMGKLQYFMASLEVIPEYLSLWLAPHPLILEDPLPVTQFPWLGVMISFSLLSVSILLSIRYSKERLVAFSLGLFWIGLFPTIGPTPIFFVMDQIRLYLPLAGLSLLMALLLTQLGRFLGNRIHPMLPLSLLILLYSSLSMAQNIRYHYPPLIWQDVIEKYPYSGLAWEHLGASLDALHLYDEAMKTYEMASRVEPGNKMVQILALQSGIKAGLPKAQLKPKLPKLQDISHDRLDILGVLNLSILEAELGEEKRAEERLLQMTQLYPYYANGHLNLGVLWERMGKLEQAKRAYANALTLSPTNRRAKEAVDRLGRPTGPP